VVLVALIALAMGGAASAQERKPGPALDPHQILRDAKDPQHVSTTIEIVFLLTVLSLAPALLVMVTSFTRIVIVLSFVRRAIGTQELPPNQVITGLALLLTFMVMSPTFGAIKRDALDPYTSADRSKQIPQAVAFDRAAGHLRAFMFQHVRRQDVALFMQLTKQPVREGGWEE
jgi:flagellar biosynthetic protein FliP